MGLTNSVQPYWRLAIIDIQMMPRSSCHHRERVLEDGWILELIARSLL
jgi:hypothetical protein